jgi:hypothetical protein
MYTIREAGKKGRNMSGPNSSKKPNPTIPKVVLKNPPDHESL